MPHNGYLLFGQFDFDVIKSSAADSSASATSLSPTYGATPTSKFHAVIAARYGTDGAAAASGVSQSGVTWVRQAFISSTAGPIVDIWLGQGTASTSVVTVNYSSTFSVAAMAVELGAGFVPDADEPTNTGTSSTASTTGTGVLRANKYALAAFAADRGDRTFSSPTNSYTLHGQIASGGGGANISMALCYKKVTGSPSGTALTMNGSADWAAVILAL